jgi:hypothetical protein
VGAPLVTATGREVRERKGGSGFAAAPIIRHGGVRFSAMENLVLVNLYTRNVTQITGKVLHFLQKAEPAT